jgi:hypothetical protein
MRICCWGIILFCFAIGSRSEAQTLTFKKTPIVFFSPSKNLFQVINNDTLYSSKGSGDVWHLSTIHYQKEMDYTTLRADFVPISTSKGDYFVVAGCGMVYELKGDSIVRIDHSFRHKNQFAGLFWTQNDTIFITGGYGFFESTNITTYFDWDTHGWYHHRCRGWEPPRFSGGCAFKGTSKMYFFNGRSEGVLGSGEVNDVRVLDTRTWEWKNLGQMSMNWNPKNESMLKFWKNDGHLARLGNRLFSVDVDNNEVTIFASDKFTSLYDLVEDGEDLLLSRVNHDQINFSVELVKKNDYLGVPLAKEQFVPVPTPNWILISVVLVMMVLVLLAWFLWNYKGREKREIPEPIQVREVETLTELERQMMVYFFELGEMGFESSDLNRFFDYGDPNFDTLKKRKDIKMRELKRKLSSITGISTDDVFLEKRLESDRRIKKLYLNPEIKRENEGISL